MGSVKSGLPVRAVPKVKASPHTSIGTLRHFARVEKGYQGPRIYTDFTKLSAQVERRTCIHSYLIILLAKQIKIPY